MPQMHQTHLTGLLQAVHASPCWLLQHAAMPERCFSDLITFEAKAILWHHVTVCGIMLLCAASCCWWMAWQDSHRHGSLQQIQESFGPDEMCRCLPFGRARSWLSGVVTGSDTSSWLSSAGPFGSCGAFALKWSVPGCFCTAGAVGCPLLWFASAFAGGSDLVPAAAA